MSRICVIGPVDHGKSTLLGHMLYLSNNSDELSRSLNKIIAECPPKMMSWKYARLLDICEEERERGKTHEFTEVKMTCNNKEYTFIDTPGHEIFVRSMLEGLLMGKMTCDVACYVIDVTNFDSAFDRGNVKEQLTLTRATGITNLIVLFNRMDVVEWNEKVVEDIKAKLSPFLKKLSWVNIVYHSISALYGKRIVPDIFQIIDNLKVVPQQDSVSIISSATSIFKCKLKVLNVAEGQLFTAGFICMMHSKNGETEVEIAHIPGKIKFLKPGDASLVLIRIDNCKELLGGKIILRKDNYTIGFGMLTE